MTTPAKTPTRQKAWLKTSDGWQECWLLAESSRLRTVELIGGAEDGEHKNIFGGASSHGQHFPALHVGETPPDFFEYAGKWIPCHKDEDWDPELRKLIPEHEKYIFQPHTAQVLTGIITGKHTLLYGDCGAGKTSVILQIANRIRMPVFRINMTEHTMVSDVIGAMGLKDGSTRFNDGPMIRAMQHGCWFLCDEINFTPTQIQTAFFSVTEGKPSYTLKENDGEVVVASPGFRFFATGNNINGDDKYAGTQPLNRALLDRFSGHGQIIHVRQMSPAQERNVLSSRVPALPDGLVKRVVKCADKIRQQGHMLTPRQVLNWASAMLVYRDATLAAETTWLNVLASESESDPQRQSLKMIVQAEFGRRIRLISRTRTPDGRIVAVSTVDDEIEATSTAPEEVLSESEATCEEDAEERLRERARSGERLQSSEINDEAELRVIWKAYRGNGGNCSYVELEDMFGLKNHNGNNALRCVKKYEKIMADQGRSLSGDAS